MKTAIFSDVHGNLPALEHFVDATRPVVDAYLCLGDVVNYGPWNDECLELTWSLPGIVMLEGNHERLFSGADAAHHEIPLVQDFLVHSRRYFSRHDLISNLSSEHWLGPFHCSHTIADKKIYRDTEVEIDRSWLIGHTHHQFRIERNGHTIINCGSIGQNRRCIDELCYAIYDDSSGTIQLHSEPYSIEPFLNELVTRGYPQHCIDYYLGKPRTTRPL